MQTYDLFAERDGERRLVASSLVLNDAAALVEGMEMDGSWPEGFDAVALGPVGTPPLMYVDGWEAF